MRANKRSQQGRPLWQRSGGAAGRRGDATHELRRGLLVPTELELDDLRRGRAAHVQTQLVDSFPGDERAATAALPRRRRGLGLQGLAEEARVAARARVGAPGVRGGLK
jgi:hypothetical protein